MIVRNCEIRVFRERERERLGLTGLDRDGVEVELWFVGSGRHINGVDLRELHGIGPVTFESNRSESEF